MVYLKLSIVYYFCGLHSCWFFFNICANISSYEAAKFNLFLKSAYTMVLNTKEERKEILIQSYFHTEISS